MNDELWDSGLHKPTRTYAIWRYGDYLGESSSAATAADWLKNNYPFDNIRVKLENGVDIDLSPITSDWHIKRIQKYLEGYSMVDDMLGEELFQI